MRNIHLKEINVILKSKRDVQWRIGLVYPNVYTIGMSGFSIKLLYHLLNQHPNIYTERIFLSQEPQIIPISIETSKRLNHFDILAFTFQFELDFINAIKMLQASNIPVYAKDRNSNHPLLIAGGPSITANHEPLSEIFDIFFIGEFESVSQDFLNSLFSNKHQAILDTILGISGFVSGKKNHNLITPIITHDLNNVDYPTGQVRPVFKRKMKELALNGFFLQVSRGCTHGCHFCLIGKIFRPQRERSLQNICSLIDLGSKKTQTNFINLIGSSTADHSQIKEIIQYIQEKKFKFVLPSIRIDSGDDLLEIIKKSGQKKLSIAPETGSDDIRYKIGKRINNSQIDSFIRKAQSHSIYQLKLYFILGLTSDPISEAREINAFISNITDTYSSVIFDFSINPFIPKKGTKLGTHCTNFQEVRNSFDYLKQNLRNKGKYKFFSVRWAAIQAILSIGGRELTPKLIKIAEKGGSYQSWKKILGDDSINYYENNYCS